MTPTPAHIPARKALAAALAARRADREEAAGLAALGHFQRLAGAFSPAPERPPLGPLALAALARLDPAPRDPAAYPLTLQHKDS